ncbi:AzlC family ABC transporter permease [Vibrio sp. SCSIO 43136]|uniref:AzlC family ABC transporter permease n=1 Tax=Vibrio sp. SCSIO 43136 TaxID=2819101 RepID=UPI0020760F72|nr:AzlC family ABC transporter permease [Vibrio sp. SCSIO 43136]USD67881.1 AzlC family ABC transporter permease [Vibrio sp. SCSIO 43136]
MNKQLMFAGAKTIAPLCIGAFPFSFIIGAMSIQAGLSITQSILSAMLTIAGSSQLVAYGMIQHGGSMLVIMFTSFVINLRHVLYSASLAEIAKGQPLHIRALMAFGLTDEVYAGTYKGVREHKYGAHWFYLGAMGLFYVNWVVANTLGALVGSSFPDIANFGLEFAMVAAFIAIVVPQLKERECIVAAVVSMVAGVLFSSLPHSLGLVVAASIGVFVGYQMDLMTEREQAAEIKKAESCDVAIKQSHDATPATSEA